MLVDPEPLRVLAGLGLPGDTNPATEVVLVFEREGERTLVALRAAAQREDGEAMKRLIHRFRGACANVGAVGLGRGLAALDAKVRAGVAPGSLRPDLEDLSDLFARTLEALPR